MSDENQDFEAWWNSAESPARHMTETAAHFCKPFMRAAFNAGKTNRQPRVKREKAARFSL